LVVTKQYAMVGCLMTSLVAQAVSDAAERPTFTRGTTSP